LTIKLQQVYSTEKCDLIVCWIENAKSDEKLKDKQKIIELPPILSIKNCFETGQINVF